MFQPLILLEFVLVSVVFDKCDYQDSWTLSDAISEYMRCVIFHSWSTDMISLLLIDFLILNL